MALTLKLYQAYNTKNMLVKIDKNPKTNLSKVSFGHHGQMSVILQQIRCYFLYKGVLSSDQIQTLLKVLCYNIKHFLALNQGQNFLAYEKNTYLYYKEQIVKLESTKKLFLDLYIGQTLLTNEYEKALFNGYTSVDSTIEQAYLESKDCENIIKKQINI